MGKSCKLLSASREPIELGLEDEPTSAAVPGQHVCLRIQLLCSAVEQKCEPTSSCSGQLGDLGLSMNLKVS